MTGSTRRFDLALPLGLVCACLAILGGCASAAPTAAPAAATTATSAAPTVAATPGSSPAVAAPCTPTPITFDPAAPIDLSGTWAGDDGGIYYVRQLDNVVWWNGMSSRSGPPEDLGRDWNNVGRGEINDDLTIPSDWADVPRGQVLGSGTVTFKVGADAQGNLQLTKESETGSGRGDTLWTPCSPG